MPVLLYFVLGAGQSHRLAFRKKTKKHTNQNKNPGHLSTGPPTGAAGASAGVFSSPPRRARLNLARSPLSAGGVWGLRVWVCVRTLENRPGLPPLLPAVHSPLPSSQKTVVSLCPIGHNKYRLCLAILVQGN